jgi:anti-sigma factor RsiW
MTDRHEHLDEGIIHAWLDGALPPDESRRVEALAGSCTECGALVAEARGLVAASSRILSSLDAVPTGVIPGTDRSADQLAMLRARKGATSRRWFRDPRMVAAASLFFMVGAVGVVWRASTSDPSVAEMRAPAPATDRAGVAAASSEPAAPPAVLPAPARDVKAEAGAPLQDRAPARIAANRAADSVVKASVEAARRGRIAARLVPTSQVRQASAP